MLKLHASSWLPPTTISMTPHQLRCATSLGVLQRNLSYLANGYLFFVFHLIGHVWVLDDLSFFIVLYLSHPISVCIWVCVCGRGGLGGTLLVILEGGGPELELGKDWRRFLSHCPAGSLLIFWFWWPIMVPGCCSGDVGSYAEGLRLLPSHVVCPKGGDVCPLGSRHPEAFQIPVFSLAVVMTFLVPVLIDLGGSPGVLMGGI